MADIKLKIKSTHVGGPQDQHYCPLDYKDAEGHAFSFTAFKSRAGATLVATEGLLTRGGTGFRTVLGAAPSPGNRSYRVSIPGNRMTAKAIAAAAKELFKILLENKVIEEAPSDAELAAAIN